MLDQDPLAGTRYRAIEVLGTGAMGDVFLAENVSLGNKVVVKVIKAHLARDPSAVDRMRLEAQAAARISHPNVINVLDFATTESGTPYLVMEHLTGRTLRAEVCARGPLPVPEAIGLARQLLEGLSAVHELGVVHRDIKPANIFLCGGGHQPYLLKIIDFGIAKVTAAASPNAPKPLALATHEGVSVGTPRFLAPEQALGYQVGPRTDLYAVGALLFWILTARDPFYDREDALEILKAHLQAQPPRPSSLNPAVPPELDEVVAKALAKKPEDRYQTAAAFSEALGLRSAALRANGTEVMDTRALRVAVQSVRTPRSAMPNETEPMPTLMFRGGAPSRPPSVNRIEGPAAYLAAPTRPTPATASTDFSPAARRRGIIVLVLVLSAVALAILWVGTQVGR